MVLSDADTVKYWYRKILVLGTVRYWYYRKYWVLSDTGTGASPRCTSLEAQNFHRFLRFAPFGAKKWIERVFFSLMFFDKTKLHRVQLLFVFRRTINRRLGFFFFFWHAFATNLIKTREPAFFSCFFFRPNKKKKAETPALLLVFRQKLAIETIVNFCLFSGKNLI